jgi:hypothetical protein
MANTAWFFFSTRLNPYAFRTKSELNTTETATEQARKAWRQL